MYAKIVFSTPSKDKVYEKKHWKFLLSSSDWPVCRVAGGEHKDIVSLAESLVERLGDEEKEMFFHLNAAKFYNLKNVEW